jgi:hypothetical protein
MQVGKNWIFPKKINANRFFWDSHWLEIWSNHLCPSMGPNGGSEAMDSGAEKLAFCAKILIIFAKPMEVREIIHFRENVNSYFHFIPTLFRAGTCSHILASRGRRLFYTTSVSESCLFNFNPTIYLAQRVKSPLCLLMQLLLLLYLASSQ